MSLNSISLEVISAINFFSVFLTLIYVFIVAIFIRGWRKLIPFQKQNVPLQTKVSILIAARNEADQIAKTLES